MTAKTFRDLDVWRLAHEVALATYRLTETFPAKERYGLTSQMRKAAVSIPANIAGGVVRRGDQDKIRLYNYAEGSAAELAYYFILAPDLKYCERPAQSQEQLDHVSRMLRRLIKAIDPAAYG